MGGLRDYCTLTFIGNDMLPRSVVIKTRIIINIQVARIPTCRLSKVGAVGVGRFRSKLVGHVGTFGVSEAEATTLPKPHQYPVVLGPGTVFIRLQ